MCQERGGGKGIEQKRKRRKALKKCEDQGKRKEGRCAEEIKIKEEKDKGNEEEEEK